MMRTALPAAVLMLLPALAMAQEPAAAQVLAFERDVEAAVVHVARMNTVDGPHLSRVT